MFAKKNASFEEGEGKRRSFFSLLEQVKVFLYLFCVFNFITCIQAETLESKRVKSDALGSGDAALFHGGNLKGEQSKMLYKSSELFQLLNSYHRQQEKLFQINDGNYPFEKKFTSPRVAGESMTSLISGPLVHGQSGSGAKSGSTSSLSSSSNNFKGFESVQSVVLQRNIFTTLIDLFRVNVNIFFNEMIRSAYKNSSPSPSKSNIAQSRNRNTANNHHRGGHQASHFIGDDAQLNGALNGIIDPSKSYDLMDKMENLPSPDSYDADDVTSQMSNPNEKRKGHVSQVIHSITDSSKPNSTDSNSSNSNGSGNNNNSNNPNNNNSNNSNNNNNNNNNNGNDSNNNSNNSNNDNSGGNSNSNSNNSNSAANGNGNNNAINQISGNSVGIGHGDLPHGVSKPTGLEPPRPEKPNQVVNNSASLVSATSSLLSGQRKPFSAH